MAAAKGKRLTMDSKFADRMLEVGEINSETLSARWAGVTTLASGTTLEQKARLLVIAAGAAIDREQDEWFWKPFRDGEDTFRIDDGRELHARLAVATLRELLGQGDQDAPLLIRLASNAGLELNADDLLAEAESALGEARPGIPSFAAPGNVYSKTNQDAIKVEGGATTTVLSDALNSIASGAQNGINSLATQIVALTEWAESATQRLECEQRSVAWLIGGVRSDGRPWLSLSKSAIILDAAIELADHLARAPQSRHEGLLGQLLATAGVTDEPTPISTTECASRVTTFETPSLIRLTPIVTAISNGTSLDSASPFDTAKQLLWETTACLWWQ